MVGRRGLGRGCPTGRGRRWSVLINLLYVGLAVGISAVASVIVVLRNRRPRSLQSGVEEFARELRALAPDPSESSRRRRR